MEIKRISVFCGSSFGTKEIYKSQAILLGETLVRHKIKLVYGGANVGLMGAIADSVLSLGGKAIGVLPEFLKTKEIAHEHLSELIIVKNMHERKSKMNELSDGIIALPGGFGTLEEFFEMLTWAQLGLHKKPIAILNIEGFYDRLITFTQNMVDEGFLKEINKNMIIVSDNVEELIEMMKNYKAPYISKWI